MSIDLLDLLLVSHFCFNAPVAWWLWVVGFLASLGAGLASKDLRAAIREIK